MRQCKSLPPENTGFVGSRRPHERGPEYPGETWQAGEAQGTLREERTSSGLGDPGDGTCGRWRREGQLPKGDGSIRKSPTGASVPEGLTG